MIETKVASSSVLCWLQEGQGERPSLKLALPSFKDLALFTTKVGRRRQIDLDSRIDRCRKCVGARGVEETTKEGAEEYWQV